MYIGSVTFLCGHVVWRMVGRLHFARSVQTAVWVYNIIVLKLAEISHCKLRAAVGPSIKH